MIMKILNRNRKNLNKKKLLLIITEILIGSGSTIGSSTMGLINPGAVLLFHLAQLC